MIDAYSSYELHVLTCKSTSESITAGHFPPSSRTTGVRCFAAAVMTMRPTLGLPEKLKKGHFS